MIQRRCLLLAAVLGCAPPGESESARSAAAATQILDGAQRALGLVPGSVAVQLVAEAEVEGPGVAFRTVVHSASDGRVRMDQGTGRFLGGVGRAGGWYRDGDTIVVGELGSRLEFMRGHELHMLATDPRSRLVDPRYVGVVPLGEELAFAVSLALPDGEQILAYFATLDTVPIGLVVASQEPEVFATWSGWETIAGLRIFRDAVFRQGDEAFRYHFTRIEVGDVPDSVYEAPGPG